MHLQRMMQSHDRLSIGGENYQYGMKGIVGGGSCVSLKVSWSI